MPETNGAGSSPATPSREGLVRPEWTPDKSPKPLARNTEKRIAQLVTISGSPSENQIASLAQKFAEDPDSLKGPDGTPRDSTEVAREAFENYRQLAEERAAIDAEIKTLRKEALTTKGLDNVKERVNQINLRIGARKELSQSLGLLGDVFLDAGIQIEPEQQAKSLNDRIQEGAYTAGWQLAAGADKAGRLAGSAAEGAAAVGSAVMDRTRSAADTIVEGGAAAKTAVIEGARTASSAVTERARSGVEATDRLMRRGVGVLVDNGLWAAREARNKGGEALDLIKGKVASGFLAAESTAGTVAGGFKSRFEAIKEAFNSGKERVVEAVQPKWQAVNLWAETAKKAVSETGSAALQSVTELVDSARNGAAARVDSFVSGMRSVGESAKDKAVDITTALRDFSTEQAQRVDNLRQQVTQRVRDELSTAREKGSIFLAPMRESIQRDRERLREQAETMAVKMDVLLGGVSDIAAPVVDRIIDEGRDARDAALGFGRKQIEGMRAFGKNVASLTGETVAPAWNFMVERWESLTLRANESRTRLNSFMEGAVGGAGARFASLKESAAARAERVNAILSGVRVEGGKIMQGAAEASTEVRDWFVNQGGAAREYLERGKEAMVAGMENLRRYWEVYAVGKWKESGLSDVDINRRTKLLRAATASSLARAASLTTAAGVEGMVMVSKVARDPKGRVALGAVALGLALVNNQEIGDQIGEFVRSANIDGIDVSAVTNALPENPFRAPVDNGMPDMSSPPIVETQPSPTPPVNSESYSTPHTSSADSVRPVVISAAETSVQPPVPEAQAAVSPPPVDSSPTIPSNPAVPEADGAIKGPENVQAVPVIGSPEYPLNQGDSVEGYARRLATDTNSGTVDYDKYYSVLEETFRSRVDYFRENASRAGDQQALAAIDRLLQAGTIDANSETGYRDLMAAMRNYGPF